MSIVQRRDSAHSLRSLYRATKDALAEKQRYRLPAKVAAWLRYHRTRDEYDRLSQGQQPAREMISYPCIWDASATMEVEPIYYYQDSWAFERIVGVSPPSHVDVGSHHKFVVFLSKLVETTTIDIRKPNTLADSVKFTEGSILELPFEDRSLASISSLCVIEHIGLGRYGDPLDPLGTEKALEELKRVTAPRGDLYISVPIDDRDRVYFNAHRAYRDETWREMIGKFEIVQARYIVGRKFCEAPGQGFGTACYHLRRPA